MKTVTTGNNVAVHYVGTFEDGTEFDNSHTRGSTLEFEVGSGRMIKGFDDNFEMHDWKDRNQARSLINEAKAIINSNRPTKDNLRPIVSKLYGLLPNVQEGIGPIDKDILAK